MKKLTVILGAGASHSINSKLKERDNEKYRPPLAVDLFLESQAFGDILNRFPKAQILASYINKELSLKQEKIGIEQILSSIQKDSEVDSRIKRQFLQIPLYLNALFGSISNSFTTKPDEYNLLVNACLKNIDDILFLTLNYDCLLEIPIAEDYTIDFSKEQDYISNPNWKLIKLHGSINWYRKFRNLAEKPLTEGEYYDYLNNSNFPLDFSDEFLMVTMKNHNLKNIANDPVYPAITVPVDGKDSNCPKTHLQTAERFLKTCKNYLVIGTSGKDQDLMSLLEKNSPEAESFLVVGNTQKGATDTHTNFTLSVPQFKKNSQIYAEKDGLTSFTYDGTMYEFLKGLK